MRWRGPLWAGVIASLVLLDSQCVAGRPAAGKVHHRRSHQASRRTKLQEVLFSMMVDEPASNSTAPTAGPYKDWKEHVGEEGTVTLATPVFTVAKDVETAKEQLYSEPRIDTDPEAASPAPPAETEPASPGSPAETDGASPAAPAEVTLKVAEHKSDSEGGPLDKIHLFKKRKRRSSPPVDPRTVGSPPSPKPSPSPAVSPPPPPSPSPSPSSPPPPAPGPPPAARRVREPPARPSGPPPPPFKHKKSHKLQHLKEKMDEKLADAGVHVHHAHD